ncbi:MAG: putative DNA binding domain-containing protein [Planctomycetes bacterium]|nr:putative DNA binding domain-containing protein [Planctomycetota bacterium]
MKESQQLEWKETWRDEYLRWICGFANADGGVIVIGRDDDGKPVGARDAEELLVDLPNKVRDVLGIMVDVRLVHDAGHDLVEIHVEPYPSPISSKGEYQYRSGSTNQELKGAALERFLLRKRGRHWDDVPEPSFAVRKLSGAAFRLFKQRASRSGRMDRAVLRDGRETILEDLELVERHGLKRAACLLFSDRPERIVSGAWIRIGFFVSNHDLRYQDEVHGHLFGQVEETLAILKLKYLKAAISYRGIQREEKLTFPEAAMREALLNAVVHKDYASGIPIQVSVYDDQLVIWNPGELPERWTVKQLLGKHASRPFNPLLANAFFRAGFIEAWGRGIEKIQHECREHGIEPPVYDSEQAGLMVTFRADPAHVAAVAGRMPGDGDARTGVPEAGRTGLEAPRTGLETGLERGATTLELVVMVLRASPEISAPELAKRLGLSLGGVKYHLKNLRDAGRIRHRGARKRGAWEVLW